MATHRYSARAQHAARVAAAGAAVAGYAWLAGGTAAFTAAATIAVAIPSVILAVIAVRWPPERVPPPRRLDITGVSYWAIAAIMFFEWEAAGFRDGSGWWHPTFSNVVSPLLEHHPVKSAAFAVWLLAGWGLIRR